MTGGTHVSGEDLPGALLAVAGTARRRLTIVAPRVDENVVEALRGALREGVSIDAITDGPVHTKMIVADEHIAALMSGNCTTAGTTLGFTEPEVDPSELDVGDEEEPAQPNVQSALIVEDPETVAALLSASRR